jgi:group II intron reverse transcriptase/maturase
MRKRRWYSLIDKVYEPKNLENAWKKVKANRGSGGIDRVSIAQFAKNKEQNLRELHRLLRNKRYRPMPMKMAYIPKPDKGWRPLGIPTIRDRIVQQALLNTFERFDVFESKFLNCSYGFRPGRNAHQAIEEVERFRDQGYVWAVDADIQRFFDTVDHELLMEFVEEEVSDGSVLKLISLFLKAGVMKEQRFLATTLGTPQGGVISPLLANIYLHSFDTEITDEGYKLVRYADDFLVLCKSRSKAEKALIAVREALANLRLSLNAEKTGIAHFNEGIQFLGFDIFEEHKVPRKRSVKKFKESVRRITRRNQPKKVEDIIKDLNPVVIGWGNYFKIGNVNWLYQGLDQWTRMRLRWFMEKRKTYTSNNRIPNKVLFGKGLKTLSSLIGFPPPGMGQR